MLKNKLSIVMLAGGMALFGAVGGSALIASAQSSSTPSLSPTTVQSSSSSQSGSTDTPESANDPKDDDSGGKGNHHAPIGGDGVVSSVTGSTIVMAEESDEGSASYTVDASKATITKDGNAATILDLKSGDKIFVKGVVAGNSVSATSVSVGHPKERGSEDKNGANESNEKDSGTNEAGE